MARIDIYIYLKMDRRMGNGMGRTAEHVLWMNWAKMIQEYISHSFSFDIYLFIYDFRATHWVRFDRYVLCVVGIHFFFSIVSMFHQSGVVVARYVLVPTSSLPSSLLPLNVYRVKSQHRAWIWWFRSVECGFQNMHVLTYTPIIDRGEYSNTYKWTDNGLRYIFMNLKIIRLFIDFMDGTCVRNGRHAANVADACVRW